MNVKSVMHLFMEFLGLYFTKAIYERYHLNNFPFLQAEKGIV
jgi:hypothetical protein